MVERINGEDIFGVVCFAVFEGGFLWIGFLLVEERKAVMYSSICERNGNTETGQGMNLGEMAILSKFMCCQCRVLKAMGVVVVCYLEIASK